MEERIRMSDFTNFATMTFAHGPQVRTVSSSLEATFAVAAMYHWVQSCSAHRTVTSSGGSRGDSCRHSGVGGACGTMTTRRAPIESGGVKMQCSPQAGGGRTARHLALALLAAGLGIVIRPASLACWLPVGELLPQQPEMTSGWETSVYALMSSDGRILQGA